MRADPAPELDAEASGRRRRRSLTRVVAGLVAVVVVLVLALWFAGRQGVGPMSTDVQDENPYAGRAGWADPQSTAARAAAQARSSGDVDRERVFSQLAAVPQGIWLEPEDYPIGKVGAYVAAKAQEAAHAGEVPTFVVYGIPGRDCQSGYSGGGLSAGDYGTWVGEIASGLRKGDRPVVVVEPDGLAAARDCGDTAQRVRLIRRAVAALRDAGAVVYVDAGHSHWIDPDQMAHLLAKVGVDTVRGFATNVSNFQTDEDETAYAEKLSDLLGGAHYIVDTSRNGHGASSQWCNPTGRAFGRQPEAHGDGDPAHLDAWVWVKPPGESDGECGGGPPAGEFWPDRAMELAAASGW